MEVADGFDGDRLGLAVEDEADGSFGFEGGGQTIGQSPTGDELGEHGGIIAVEKDGWLFITHLVCDLLKQEMSNVGKVALVADLVDGEFLEFGG